MRTSPINRLIAAACFFTVALLGLDRLLSSGFSCDATNNYYEVLPLGWMHTTWLACMVAQGPSNDTPWSDNTGVYYTAAGIGFLSLCVCGLIAGWVLVIVIKKLQTAVMTVGAILAGLCAISCVLTLIADPWWTDVTRSCGYLIVPVILIATMITGRRGLVWTFRILLVLAVLGVLIGVPAAKAVYDFYTYYPGYDGFSFWFLITNDLFPYYRLNIGNAILFVGVLVLGFASRSTTADAAFPHADNMSVWYAVVGAVIPVVGLIAWLMWRKPMPKRAKSMGIGTLIGAIVWAIAIVVYLVVTHTPSTGIEY